MDQPSRKWRYLTKVLQQRTRFSCMYCLMADMAVGASCIMLGWVGLGAKRCTCCALHGPGFVYKQQALHLSAAIPSRPLLSPLDSSNSRSPNHDLETFSRLFYYVVPWRFSLQLSIVLFSNGAVRLIISSKLQ